MCDSFYLILLSHFTVFYFISYLDIWEGKAFLTDHPPLANSFMIDVTMKEIIKLTCKHNARCLNFYFYTVSCRIKKSGTPKQF